MNLDNLLEPTYLFGPRKEPVENGDVFEELPFKRSVLGTLIFGVFSLVFCIPYFTVGEIFGGPGTDSLFGLVMMLFGAFWLTGWTVGVVSLAVLFVGSMFGRETVHARPGYLIVRKELFGIGMGSEYAFEDVMDLRRDEGDRNKQYGWRGVHLAFDYGEKTARFGCNLDDARAERLLRDIERVGAAEPARWSEPNDLRPPPTSIAATAESGSSGTTSILALVLANLVPLLGVLFADWRIGDVMLVFWAESAIIGFFNLLKMWMIGRWIVLVAGPFFIGHFGGFMIGHLLFIYGIFVSPSGQPDTSTHDVLLDFVDLWPALLALCVSHAISYKENFLDRREYDERQIKDLMREPYARIIVMHVTLLLGGAAAMAAGDPIPALLLLIGLKIFFDVKAHRKQHDPDEKVRTARRKRVLAAAARRKSTR